jgi:hypothetical protein
MGIDAYRKKEVDLIEQFGFVTRFITDDYKCPFGINYCTHGLYRTFKHPNLQICFQIDARIAHDLFHIVVNMIRDGKKFVAGKKYSGIAEGYNTEFIDAIENGRPVLRMLIPDKDGTYSEPIFSKQLKMLDNS